MNPSSSSQSKPVDSNPLLIICSHFPALILVLAGGVKLLAPLPAATFIVAVNHLPLSLAVGAIYVLALYELFLGLSVTCSNIASFPRKLVAITYALFIVELLFAIVVDDGTDCGCFGQFKPLLKGRSGRLFQIGADTLLLLGSLSPEIASYRSLSRRVSRVTKSAAFTLLELLVVVAIIAIIASLLLPGLTGAKTRSSLTACLSNARQLQIGYLSYTEDFADRLPNNRYTQQGTHYYGETNSWTGFNNARPDNGPASLKQGSLFRYIGALGVYKCPADKATVQGRHAARSYSIDWILNGVSISNGSDIAFNVHDSQNPSETFVFIDESNQSIDDGHFFLLPAPYPKWINRPAERHSATVLTILDGSAQSIKFGSSDLGKGTEPALGITRLQSLLPRL